MKKNEVFHASNINTCNIAFNINSCKYYYISLYDSYIENEAIANDNISYGFLLLISIKLMNLYI
jgi:hypothetical protein